MDDLCHILSLDLGKTGDPSALLVVERALYPAGAFYDVRSAHRWHLGTPYSAPPGSAIKSVVGDTLTATRDPRLKAPCLVVDQTGVGQPVVEMLRYEAQCDFTPITITAGFTHNQNEDGWRVPKKDLVGAVQAVLGTRRLRWDSSRPFVGVLRKELDNFRIKQSQKTGHEAFSHREGEHDDLVLALACAIWVGENLYCGTVDNTVARAKGKSVLASAPPGVFETDALRGGESGRSRYEPRND